MLNKTSKKVMNVVKFDVSISFNIFHNLKMVVNQNVSFEQQIKLSRLNKLNKFVALVKQNSLF